MSQERPGRGTLAGETLAAAAVVAITDIIGFALAGLGCYSNATGFCAVVKGERSVALNYFVALVPVVLMLVAGAWTVRRRDRKAMKVGLMILIPVSLVLPISLIGL